MFPLRWLRRLRAARARPTVFDLAITVLAEQFKLEQMAIKEIVLSEQVTGLPRGSRRRAIDSLTKLGLIRVKRGVGKAVRVSKVNLHGS